MRLLILSALLLAPIAAFAQGMPQQQQFSVPANIMQHAVTFLQAGGTHAEGQSLADQLIALAQQQVAAQQQAPKPALVAPPAEPKPADK